MKKTIYFLSALLLIVSFISVLPQPSHAATKDMLIVLDASGSMTEMFGSVSRIDAAKSSISDLLASLDPSIRVGFRPYAQIKKDAKIDACQVTSLVQPFTTNYSLISNAVSQVNAVGAYTPTAYTLSQVKNDFTAGNDNVVILLTDGKETCGGDPAQAAADLLAAGIKVKTYVIGLGLDASSQTQLTSVASRGGGKYFDATDTTSLASSFQAIQSAEKPIDKTNTDSLLGTSVTGGNGFYTAVPIVSGTYHLSHNQLPSRYDYFKMNVNVGDVISYSIRNNENEIHYDPATNSFTETSDHHGDPAGVKLYSESRVKLDSVGVDSASSIDKSNITIDSDSAGTLYFLVGNNRQETSYWAVMSKADVFTIKVTSPTPSNAPTSADVITPTGSNGGSSNGNSSNTGVPDQYSNVGQNPAVNPVVVASDQSSSGSSDLTKGLKNTFYIVLAIIIGSAILVILTIVLIIYFVVKKTVKKNPINPISSISSTTNSPVKPTPTVTPQTPVTPSTQNTPSTNTPPTQM